MQWIPIQFLQVMRLQQREHSALTLNQAYPVFVREEIVLQVRLAKRHPLHSPG